MDNPGVKVNVVCKKCREKSMNQGSLVADIYMVPVSDDGVYEFTCRVGHQMVAGWQAQKFEVIFELAIHAIADGYHREAVASATAALERFYVLFQGCKPKRRRSRAGSRNRMDPHEEAIREAIWCIYGHTPLAI